MSSLPSIATSFWPTPYTNCVNPPAKDCETPTGTTNLVAQGVPSMDLHQPQGQNRPNFTLPAFQGIVELIITSGDLLSPGLYQSKASLESSQG
ncbi:hypothetical protein BKA82DRAFT_4356658 [Pisolithus tinctorius]|nr:hypothetical protein BKA82DRAFT_4356658 [Pisolithus tinctorius]